MSDDNLTAAKAVDGFKSESPIRAFTDFQVAGTWAIGKGFRPSLAHLTTYLDAMQHKEGWQLVQMLTVDGRDPTMIFQRDRILSHTLPERSFTIRGPISFEDVDAYLKEQGFALVADGGRLRYEPERMLPTGSDAIALEEIVRPGGRPTFVPLADDPVNPKHYDGRECADIGERLSANGYQVLKYCWRLGKKDDPCVELGKALWYIDSETALLDVFYPGDSKLAYVRPNVRGLAADQIESFLEDRIADQSTFTQNIARMLWSGYTRGRTIQAIREAIDEHRFHLDCGRGLAV